MQLLLNLLLLFLMLLLFFVLLLIYPLLSIFWGIGWLFCVFVTCWLPRYSKTAIVPSISVFFPFHPKPLSQNSLLLFRVFSLLSFFHLCFSLLILNQFWHKYSFFLSSSIFFSSFVVACLFCACAYFFQNVFVKPCMFQTHVVLVFLSSCFASCCCFEKS